MAVTRNDLPEGTYWVTEGGVDVIDFEGDGPWWQVWLERPNYRRMFWYRGDTQRVLEAAHETDVRRVAITPVDRLNEYLTAEE